MRLPMRHRPGVAGAASEGRAVPGTGMAVSMGSSGTGTAASMESSGAGTAANMESSGTAEGEAGVLRPRLS